MQLFSKNGVLLLPLAVLTAIPSWSQDARFRFSYAAKFVCGLDPAGTDVRVIPGQYATSVAVHNPSRTDTTIRKRVSLTFPPSAQEPGSVSDYIQDTLGPTQALQVDCEEIPAAFFPGQTFPPYIQGFLVIQSTSSVDVTAIVTAGDSSQGPVRTVSVQQVEQRLISATSDSDSDD